ncbi:uncharacterized protein MYCFIDRAFT_212975 [Pseudocercospora fijiensis CIRAD86]|uniref:Major facilitator superfamily (MFS) profile domain-containing protein n=1 Tax=Pseudocercospora fijiensis (strain CIRAD86) TaxID=383855 RepID=N1Q9U7_PSEFD|nr:uncharacterized protein MYCFIDRAFT_212975 [Pseudocercospora fijiensis CIRAD86]EME87662.1 hypothetical protein MYCFIDRAFT_212975 [Pseudocercospora fijiensis CIRAD86]
MDISCREGDVPGTVDLRAAEGDDTAFGQAWFPVPAEDPDDPLQWPTWTKTSILVICSLYSFFSITALLGPSFSLHCHAIYAEQFGITPTKPSGLVSYPNFLYGVGTLVTVPMYLKFGRRLVILLSLVVYLAGLIGCSRANGLMTARLIHTLSSGVCEVLPVQLVNDIFFRPLYAGYMLAGGESWRLYFYVEIAFAAVVLILAFLFVEETYLLQDETLRSRTCLHLFFTGTLAYAVDSYNANVPEMLIAMCVGKQLISFGFGEKVLDWVARDGYAVIIAGAFCGVLFANNLCVFIFMFFGKRIRRFYAGTWLARFHKDTIREIMAH